MRNRLVVSVAVAVVLSGTYLYPIGGSIWTARQVTGMAMARGEGAEYSFTKRCGWVKRPQTPLVRLGWAGYVDYFPEPGVPQLKLNCRHLKDGFQYVVPVPLDCCLTTFPDRCGGAWKSM